MKEAETKSNCLKKTKLGWIPMDWETQKLVELCNSKGSYGINASAVSYREDLPAYLRITDIDDEGNFSRKKKMSVDDPNYESFILQKGDVVFVRTGATVGKTYLYDLKDGELVYAGFLIKFSIKESILNSSYLKYFTQSENYWKWVNVMSVRSGQPGINGEEYGGLNVPLPPLPEQETIANCLSVWDAAITKQTKLIATKKQLKKALMQKLLSGKKRLSGFEKDWKINRFDFFLDYTPRPVQKPEAAFIKLGIRSHCKGTFQNLGFEPEEIAIDTLYLVKPKDLIVNITFAWEGAVAIVKDKDAGALVSHRFPTYTFKDGISDTDFFKQFIQSKRFRYLLELISPGGAGRNRVLSKKELNKLKIKIPPYDEQVAIAKILKSADQEIELFEKHLKQLKKQKKGLMQQLLTGKKRLKY